LVLPDHPTPIALRTHVNEPVPFILYDNRDNKIKGEGGYSEWSVRERNTDVVIGHQLIDHLCEQKEYSEICISSL
jgi:2,3-bisphosphoglycerate-independent phosphoglycerate mutase